MKLTVVLGTPVRLTRSYGEINRQQEVILVTDAVYLLHSYSEYCLFFLRVLDVTYSHEILASNAIS